MMAGLNVRQWRAGGSDPAEGSDAAPLWRSGVAVLKRTPFLSGRLGAA